MTKIRPITDLRNTKEMSNLCRETSEPIYITSNGKEDMVIMSVEAYERDKMLLDVYRKIGEAEQHLQDGVDTIDADEVFSKLREKYDY